jgi:hypothetical protein
MGGTRLGFVGEISLQEKVGLDSQIVVMGKPSEPLQQSSDSRWCHATQAHSGHLEMVNDGGLTNGFTELCLF